jgi:uncharacterized protein DUF262/uncharacterized protein DUF1524
MNIPLPLADTPTVGLGRFIKESRFVVPTHQRDFSWTDVYVNAFLKDIEDALEKKSDIYFCGLMVFTRASTQLLKVLDGQQRLATTLMIFSAIRNWFRQRAAYKKQEVQVETQLLQNEDIGASAIEPKLILTPANNDVFQQFITSAATISEIERALESRPSEDRNKTLLKATLLINRHIERKAAEFGSQDAARDYFLNLIRYLTDTVQVVRFVLSGDSAAYTIFETLNDRGLALAPLDLVKNYVFSRAESYRTGSLRDFEERWAEMMTLLGSMKVDSFLRAFWASRHGTMEGTKLFTSFKNKYDEPEKVHGISVEMRAASERYAALSSSTDATWSGYPANARKSVDGIETIGSTQLHPIILAALERFPKPEMFKLLHLLEVIAVRFQLVGRGRPGRIESLGGRAAREIWENRITKTSQVRSVLEELYISDADFVQRFKTKTEKDGKKARYILVSLERQALLREGKTYADELIPGSVTLEHIFPKSPKAQWAEETKVDAKLPGMVNRLGNVCLLTDVNRALGNKGYDEKLEVFKKSRLLMTNSVSSEQFPQWGSAAIEKRQGYMAELAKAAWRYDGS